MAQRSGGAEMAQLVVAATADKNALQLRVRFFFQLHFCLPFLCYYYYCLRAFSVSFCVLSPPQEAKLQRELERALARLREDPAKGLKLFLLPPC